MGNFSARIRSDGTAHLILEVLAYAAEEAESTRTTGRCVVTLHADGSVSVADNGRGTATRPLPPRTATGTTVHVLPADSVHATPGLSPSMLRRLAAR